MSEHKEEVTHVVTHEDEKFVYGKTFTDEVYYGDWCRYKLGGNPANTVDIEWEEVCRRNWEEGRANGSIKPYDGPWKVIEK